MENNLNRRYVAIVTIEAVTPLKVGSSDVDMLQDAPVQKDWNGLPMILGTSIAGVLRKSFENDLANEIFGDEHSRKKDNRGSRLIISNALLCDADMKVHERLLPNEEKSAFLKLFDNLPLRDHVRITDRGVADTDNAGKFDEEVVYKGSRFRFRMELSGTDEDAKLWQQLLQRIRQNRFRLGGGTTRGFGEISVVETASSYEVFDVKDEAYANADASLNTTYANTLPEAEEDEDLTHYRLELQPDDFFMFGSGFGDDDADQIPVYEKVIDYTKGDLSDEKILIPASSIKGALSHRVAYHYNKAQLEAGEDHTKTGEENAAVNALFGEAKEDGKGRKGRLLMSDCYLQRSGEKVFDHVAIDRFTGGAIESALFNEKSVAGVETFSIDILLDTKGLDESSQKAFEMALKDITSGMLPLGGATTKGHGVFSGEVRKNGEKL